MPASAVRASVTVDCGAIAESLVLTKRAVEKHVNAIFSKLNLPETDQVSRRVKATLIFLAEETPDGAPDD